MTTEKKQRNAIQKEVFLCIQGAFQGEIPERNKAKRKFLLKNATFRNANQRKRLHLVL